MRKELLTKGRKISLVLLYIVSETALGVSTWIVLSSSKDVLTDVSTFAIFLASTVLLTLKCDEWLDYGLEE